ncbi:hypothetical protein EYF80_031194 [Liparis tanakae]|uniref:Uncharacterized protein n=1 Tax=Liparis tanakae TaxID=230148 RepID=A0A4Z2H163_9TELE|nr:hypothetical protein EYF80_031194 [Liparis tanakae]
MRLPGQSNRVGAEDVHQVSPSGDALGGFKSRVALAQNEHGLVLVVLGVGGDGVVALDQLGTGELDLLRLPQTRGHQEDAGGGERVRLVLVGQDVAPALGCLHCLDPPDVHAVPDLQPELLLKDRQIHRIGVGGREEVPAHSLQQEVAPVAQQRVPVVAHVELSVLGSRVDLVDADERPVPGDDVVSFSLGEEISHLQPRGPGAQHAVLVAAGAGVLVAVGKASQAANQDEGKDQTRKCRIHNLLDAPPIGVAATLLQHHHQCLDSMGGFGLRRYQHLYP